MERNRRTDTTPNALLQVSRLDFTFGLDASFLGSASRVMPSYNFIASTNGYSNSLCCAGSRFVFAINKRVTHCERSFWALIFSMQWMLSVRMNRYHFPTTGEVSNMGGTADRRPRGSIDSKVLRSRRGRGVVPASVSFTRNQE
jgi:hypothetical protein